MEPVGSEAYAYLRFGSNTLIARFAPDDLPSPGAIVPLRIAPGTAHVFDATTGLRLTAAS